VVTGINIGSNYGSAFTVGSGTVGAALEGAISGIDSVALSATSLGESFRDWARRMRRSESEPTWARLADVGRAIVADVLEHGLGDLVDVLSVNMPDNATPDTPRLVTSLAVTHYQRLFQQHGEGLYRHDWISNSIDHRGDPTGTDVHIAQSGSVSMTPLHIAGLGQSSQRLSRLLDRP
ncbi:MAG: hypothetical protein HKO76_00165, partial [Acidimicrobiia bacterium]|nr:hypothetical protein [Acidimicrobiia bacterium]